MRNKSILLILLGSFLVLVFMMTGCATRSYFGVPNQALGAPDEFWQTEAAIASAENSEGAKNCPEKIARAKALAKEGVETYWACRAPEATDLLSQARKLAKEAESCQPPPRATAPPPPAPKPVPTPSPLPPPKPRVEEKVIILASEPKVEEKVIALVAEPKVEQKVIILAFEDIHFDFDKSTLTNEAQVILKRNIQILKDNPKAKVRIAGYTSASGTEEYNQRLSERRATAVTEYLTKEGIIAPNRLSKIGYGETKPAMYEAAPKDLYSKAAKANMRVLFEIIVE